MTYTNYFYYQKLTALNTISSVYQEGIDGIIGTARLIDNYVIIDIKMEERNLNILFYYSINRFLNEFSRKQAIINPPVYSLTLENKNITGIFYIYFDELSNNIYQSIKY